MLKSAASARNEEQQNNSDMFAHPNIKNVKDIDQKMDETLNKSDLTDFEKVEKYNALLEKYIRNFRNALETSKSEAILGEPASKTIDLKNTTENESIKQFQSLEESLDSIPTSYRQKARKLVDFLKNNNSFSVNQNNELLYKDQVLRGSNVNQLINDAVRSKKPITSDALFTQFVENLNAEGYPAKQILSKSHVQNPPIASKISLIPKMKKSKPQRRLAPYKYSSQTVDDILKNWVSSK